MAGKQGGGAEQVDWQLRVKSEHREKLYSMPAGISPLAIHESGYYLHADFSFEFGSHLHEFSFCYTVNS